MRMLSECFALGQRSSCATQAVPTPLKRDSVSINLSGVLDPAQNSKLIGLKVAPHNFARVALFPSAVR